MVGVPDPVLRLCSKPTTRCGGGQVRPDPDISINVDIRNPGQFFACCGLLEISSRLWPESEGWFEITGRRATYRIATNNGHQDALGEIVRTVSEPDVVIETDRDHYDAGLRPLM